MAKIIVKLALALQRAAFLFFADNYDASKYSMSELPATLFQLSVAFIFLRKLSRGQIYSVLKFMIISTFSCSMCRGSLP